ncbi:MAG TPA: SHOCT domain-containing protein [Natronoarchaeum rubrum]|nr:SHOCT domain-containing protein [Natronoarchaeum rubrum]
MSGLRERFDEHPVAITALVMLGLGLTAAIAEIAALAALFFTVGFTVVVPLVYLLYDAGDGSDDSDAARSGSRAVEDDPIEELRRRYAAGQLTEDEFERKLERLLETEDVGPDADGAAEREGSKLERELE